MSDPIHTPAFPRKLGGLPLRGIRVEVVAGVDAGMRVGEGLDRIRIGSAEGNDLVLHDPMVSRFHLEVVRRDDRIVVIDHRSTNGTRIGPVWLASGDVAVEPGAQITIGQSTLRVDDGSAFMLDLGSPSGFHGVRGRSAAIRRVTASLEKLAQKDAPVLVVGESGTGKEVVARALHDAGPRRERPFVTLDCGAVAQNLFVGEIMGHERGAYTGADVSRPGVFERAHGGTVFLDEIGELPIEHQSALLGVLERRRVKRLGGKDEIPFDVRVVAATNRDLRAAVNAGSFRLDLFFRLAVVSLHVPPLRERYEDIPVLIEHFLREEGEDAPLASLFSAEQLGSLSRHDWPGNVRELKNFVLATLATGVPPSMGTLGAAQGPADVSLDEKYRDARRKVVDAFELAYLRRLLTRSGNNVREAARIAGMDRSYLIELLTRHGLRS